MTDADRTKAAAILRHQLGAEDVDRVAHALASERAAAVADLRARVLALAQEWDTDHADWCCQRGCPNFDGTHPGDVQFTTEGCIEQLGPDFPCPGECTCYVGPFRDTLRAAVTDTCGSDGQR